VSAPRRKLRSVPELPPTGRRPVDAFPKPTYTGTKPSAEVTRALRGVMRNATPLDRKLSDAMPHRIVLLLWTVAIGGLLAVACLAIAADWTKGREVKTYPLYRP